MRALSAFVVLSPIILGGYLTSASAQSVGFEDLSPGALQKPTTDSPGVATGITLGELYTDNLTLGGPDHQNKGGWITEIQPFVNSAFSTPRLSGVLDYMLTGYLYPGNSSYNQLAQNLDAHGKLTILPQHFFLDGTAVYGQEIVNGQRPGGAGAYFLDNNHANVARATLSPYWIQDLGNVGTMSLRYTIGRVAYNDKGISGENRNLLAGVSNSTSKVLQFDVVSPKGRTWGWSLGYSDRRVQWDIGTGVDYAVAKLGTYLQVNTSTRLLADVGKESNFLPDGTIQKWGANFWDVGFDWSNMRDSLKVLVGHRFYGRSAQLSWVHTAALLTMSIRYVEQPTDLTQQLLGQNSGQIIAPPIGASGIPSLRERGVYLMKRVTASADYEMPRGRLSVTLYDERRTNLTSNEIGENVANANVANANVDWRFDVGAFTTLTSTVGWQRYQFTDGEVRYTNSEQLALVHHINPKNFGSVRLRHSSSNVYSATPVDHGYGVNVIFVQWTHLF